MPLLYIRFRQICYLIKHLHIYFLLIAGGIVLTISIAVKLEQQEIRLCLSGFYLLFLLSKQATRKDRKLILRSFQFPHIQLYIDLLLFSIPLFIILLFTKEYLLVFCLPIVLFLGNRLDFSKNTPSIHFPKLSCSFLSPNYEFQSAFRRYGVLITGLYIGALALCWVKFISFVLLYSILVLFSDAIIQTCEPLSMLRASLLPPQALIRYKVKHFTRLWALLILPNCMISSFIYPEYWYIYLLFFVYSAYMLALLVWVKYGEYTPNSKRYNVIIYTFAILSPVIPVFIPVCFLLGWVYYPRSIENLKNYLC